MLIGTMNHPARNLMEEIGWIAGLGFDFIDLTLEPPMAAARSIDGQAVRDAIRKAGLEVVGHTAYYLPLGSPFDAIRRAAVDELTVCLEAFAGIGAKWMNLHPDRQAPLHDRKFIIEQNLRTLRELLVPARQLGVGLMIENLPGTFNTAKQMGELLDPLPEVGLHLDIGHANLLVETNATDELLAKFGPRLRHVHLHDNKGGSADLHLPLRTGTVDTKHYVQSLKRAGYNGTITLEVFTPDRRHVDYSREVLRRIWDESPQVPMPPHAV